VDFQFGAKAACCHSTLLWVSYSKLGFTVDRHKLACQEPAGVLNCCKRGLQKRILRAAVGREDWCLTPYLTESMN